MLSAARKEELFRLAIGYAGRANATASELHSLVSADLGRPMWWTQNETLPVTVGIVGEVRLPSGLGIQITTARCADDPAVVSFVYTHEIGHVLLKHYQEGSFLYGFYTRREAEADAFAYAFLYATVEKRCPCGKPLYYQNIYAAMKKIHAQDPGFVWPQETRLRDIKVIRTMAGFH